jgi:predicted transcriptional regulator
MTQDGATWTFLTNHTHVLLCIHRNAEIRLREIAQLVGITERAVQKIVSDLSDSGHLRVDRVGRRNRYTIRTSRRLRHPLERDHAIGALLNVLSD